MKWLAGALLTVVLLLQYRLWLSGDGVSELTRLSEAVEQQKSDNDVKPARIAACSGSNVITPEMKSCPAANNASRLGADAPDAGSAAATI
jgi:hypothetical protein